MEENPQLSSVTTRICIIIGIPGFLSHCYMHYDAIDGPTVDLRLGDSSGPVISFMIVMNPGAFTQIASF